MSSYKKYFTFFVLIIAIFALGNLQISASTVELSKEQKMEYYKQYKKIVNELNSEEPNSTLELGPLEDFTAEDFIEPSVFKKYASERSNVTFNIISNATTEITPFSSSYASTKKTITSHGSSVTITISNSFNTQYSAVHQRQMLAGINYIKAKSSVGTWSKSTSSGYSARLIDGGRTFEVIVSGKLTINNLTSSHHIVIEFYCNEIGSLS